MVSNIVPSGTVSLQHSRHWNLSGRWNAQFLLPSKFERQAPQDIFIYSPYTHFQVSRPLSLLWALYSVAVPFPSWLSDSPVWYVLIIQSNVESVLKIIQFNVQLKFNSELFIQSKIHSKVKSKIFNSKNYSLKKSCWFIQRKFDFFLKKWRIEQGYSRISLVLYYCPWLPLVLIFFLPPFSTSNVLFSVHFAIVSFLSNTIYSWSACSLVFTLFWSFPVSPIHSMPISWSKFLDGLSLVSLSGILFQLSRISFHRLFSSPSCLFSLCFCFSSQGCLIKDQDNAHDHDQHETERLNLWCHQFFALLI